MTPIKALQAQPECIEESGTVTCEYLSDGTFTVPAGVTTITVETWGGGGGGAGAYTALGLGAVTRGGGGGAYARSVLNLSPETTHVITIGAGGEGGPDGNNDGTDGGASSFGSGPLVLAAGGAGGPSSIFSSNNADGGLAVDSEGDIIYEGGGGAAGGGGGAGSNGSGGDADQATGGTGTANGGGDGGSAPSSGLVTSSDGNPGNNFGGGGSGGRLSAVSLLSPAAGGDGAQGRVVVTYDIPTTLYSRQTGNWDETSTWTYSDTHSGDPVSAAPAAENTMIIGASHTVSFTEDVINDEWIQVKDTGILQTGSHELSGSGDFTLEPGGSLGIGSPDGISDSGNSGNIQVSGNRAFSTEANYIYNGSQVQSTGSGLPETVNNLTIDNANGVTALGDHIINGQLTLQDGVFTMPPGSSLVVSNNAIVSNSGEVLMQKTIDGNKGWRMVTSPVNTTYGDLFNGFVTQGFTGSNFSDLQPNLLWFDETDAGTTLQGWRQPENITNSVVGGRGYFHYVFNGAERPDQSTPYGDVLPITMTATGLEYGFNGSTFSFDVTFTERNADADQENEPWVDINEADEGWNLIGNPTTATLNWDHTPGWTKTNMDNTIYVWDPEANAGNGDYLVWNGTEGSLGGGLIAPFQSFWVRANSENPVLAFSDEVKTTGGEFVGASASAKKNAENTDSKNAVLELELHSGELSTKSFISLKPEGLLGEDPRDAYQLEPMNDTWLTLFTSSDEDNRPLVINSLPLELDHEVSFPLHVGGARKGDPIDHTFRLEWTLPEDWPENVFVTLVDHNTKQTISMHEHKEYQFNYRTPSSMAKSVANSSTEDKPKANPDQESQQQLQPPGSITFSSPRIASKRMKKNGETRFGIRLSLDGENSEYESDEIILDQNYPNPFTSTTTIPFSLPEEAEVRLEVFDILGRKVVVLANDTFPEGTHNIKWDAGNQASGIYLYRLIVIDNKMLTGKMLLIK